MVSLDSKENFFVPYILSVRDRQYSEVQSIWLNNLQGLLKLE